MRNSFKKGGIFEEILGISGVHGRQEGPGSRDGRVPKIKLGKGDPKTSRGEENRGKWEQIPGFLFHPQIPPRALFEVRDSLNLGISGIKVSDLWN